MNCPECNKKMITKESCITHLVCFCEHCYAHWSKICGFCLKTARLCEHGFCRLCGCKEYCWID